MRVALDISCAAKPHRTGVARYATCLADAMLRAFPDDAFTLGVRASRWRRRSHRYAPGAANARARWFVEPLLGTTLGPFDVFHGLDARLPRRRGFPTVATLHDIGGAADAAIADAGFREKKRAAYAWLAERADRIVCVSAATRDAFRAWFDLSEERFAVVHHGIEPRFTAPDRTAIDRTLSRLGVRKPYLLFVGLLSARKNLLPLVRAFDRVARARDDLSLVLAGGRAHGFEEVAAAIASTRARDRVVLPGFVADADLPALYAGAELFVFPGLAEGFGLPMLEAMACGTPVVAADVPVAREVVGEDGGPAVLCDTTDDDALARALLHVVGNPTRGRALREAGRAHAATFTWERAARATMDVYREVAG